MPGDRARLRHDARLHGSTFGGNPLACAVANAVLDVLLEDGLSRAGARMAERLRASWTSWPPPSRGVIREVRGQGLLLGLRCGPPNTDVSAS